MPPSVLSYHSPVPTFALAFSPLASTTAALKLAVGSHVESHPRPDGPNAGAPGDVLNDITVIGLRPDWSERDEAPEQLDEHGYARRRSAQDSLTRGSFVPLARAPHVYPPSAIGFSPASLSSSLQSSNLATGPDGGAGERPREMVATSSECLRLWDLVDDSAMNGTGYIGERGRMQGTGSRLVQRAMLANSKTDYSAPLTSFSWSTLEPTHIVTSSIDTTCTVWDISTSVPITQLIAHDREVYDVAWSPATRDVFASVGADGSVRMFDLRALEHSTILYEAASVVAASTKARNGSSISPSAGASATATPLPSPLLRLAFSPTSPTYLSVVHADSNVVQILDTRSPGTPAMEVRGHRAAVNGMAWAGGTMGFGSSGNGGGGETSGPGWLATCSDDSSLLLYDLSAPSTPTPATSSRTPAPAPTKIIDNPILAYSAPSEVNSVAWGGGGRDAWVAAGCGRLVRLLRV